MIINALARSSVHLVRESYCGGPGADPPRQSLSDAAGRAVTDPQSFPDEQNRRQSAQCGFSIPCDLRLIARALMAGFLPPLR